jgi:hypothetical protein
MSSYTITEVNAATGVENTREMTPEEVAAYEAFIAEHQPLTHPD